MEQSPFAKIFEKEYGRTLAFLYGYFRDYELAEDALQDALTTALERWPKDGLPDKPGAWLTVVAKNRGLDVIRKRQRDRRREEAHQEEQGMWQPDFTGDIHREFPDERLELLFSCCHPALAPESQTALTLRSFGRLTTKEIALAFMVEEKTMAQRLVRAKRKLSGAGIPFAIPSGPDLLPRFSGVLQTIYLIFNEGYYSLSSDHPVRQDLVQDALFLIQSLKDMVLQSSLPFPRAETLGLAALIYLALARQPARGDGDEHILLEDQDRSLWDQQSIREGERLLDQALALRDPGPYQLQAAISALHCQSPSFEETDWTQICLLYQKLITVLPSPAAQLAYVVALANQGEISQAEQIHAQLAAAPLAQDLSYHMTEAFLYEKREKIKQAIEVYQRLLKEKRSPSQMQTIQAKLSRLKL